MGRGIRVSISVILLVLLVHRISAQKQKITFTIREEQDPGTFVGNVARAKPMLLNQFNQSEFEGLKYGLPDKVSKFTIDRETSSMWTAQRLDREAECEGLIPSELCTLTFDVSVYRLKSDDSFQLLKVIEINIVIDDVNDNPPEFPSSTATLNVPESLNIGEVLRTSGAIDKDSGPNNTVQGYRLLGGGVVFDLQVKENSNGRPADLGIVLRSRLDREKTASYDMKIVAEDGGFPRRSGTVNIRVNVVDINDNRPLFASPIFEATVPENTAASSKILTLVASDPDENENGKLTYSFEPYTSSKVKEHFSINAKSGEITLKKAVDYEKDKTFKFYVIVKDNGYMAQSSEASVSIVVEDINDNAPQLDLTLPSVFVKESVAVGNYIGHISLSDLDAKQSFVDSCTVVNDHFRLQRFPDSDSIVTVLLKTPLDFEKSQTEVVNVTCNDGGNPPLYNSTSFTLNVLDVNDNAPVFTRSSYRFEIQEGNYIGEFVGQVEAKDPDQGINGNVSYSLITNPENIFKINPISGVIKAMSTMDRERKPSYQVEVMAKDSGKSPIASTSTVMVIVKDINDNAPKFIKPHFDFKVQENKPRHTIVDTLFARDPDVDSDNHLKFEFGNDFIYSHLFDIDRMTGTIFTLQSLDRETVDSYSFNVVVFDSTQPSFMDLSKVTIMVMDDNDFKPNITFPSEYNNTFHILYTRPPGSTLMTVTAEDHDIGDNGTVSFSIIHGNDRDLFFINPLEGHLLIAKRMHIHDAGPYHLAVLARDGGPSYLESVRNIHIVVTVANGTAGLLDDGSDSTNIAIVIALVCVTSVLALAVIVTICIIRRIDRERKHHNVAKIEEENIYKQQVIPGPPIRCDSYENEVDKLKKKIRRDVSFVVEDDSNSLDASDVTNQSSTFTTFKNTTSSSLEKKVHATPQAHSSVLQNTLSPSETNTKRVHYMDKGLDIDRLTTNTPPPRSQPLESSVVTSSSATSGSSMRGGKSAHWSGARSQSPRRSTRKAPVVEDSASHSSGSTSDSGRGCSSEEGEGQPQSHALVVSLGESETERPILRTYPTTSHLTTFNSPRSVGSSSGTSHLPRSLSSSLNSETARKRLWNEAGLSTPSSSGTGKSNNSADVSSPFRKGPYPEKPGSSSYFKPNISFSDDSVTANTSLGASRNGHQKNSNQCAKGPMVKLPTNLVNTGSRSATTLNGPINSPGRASLTSTHRDRYGSQQQVSPNDTSYRMGITNLSRIPNADTSLRHGTFIEGPSTSLVDPYANNSRNRSYANVHNNPRGGERGSSGGISNGSHRNSFHGKSSHGRRGGSSNLSRVGSCENNATQNSTTLGGNPYSLADVDDVLENASNVTNSHMDDDNTTTTSGSYTINADDLYQEIDHLFFNDVVV